MTYARARLWLGISGVGSLVVMATLALSYGLPSSLLASSQQFSWTDVGQIIAVAFAVNLWMTPFDYLGGYRLPRKFNKSSSRSRGGAPNSLRRSSDIRHCLWRSPFRSWRQDGI